MIQKHDSSFATTAIPTAASTTATGTVGRKRQRVRAVDRRSRSIHHRRRVFTVRSVESVDGLLPKNYTEKGKRVAIECRACGGSLEVRPARLERQKRGPFCTLECYGDWLSENVVGPDHHQWEGGSINYGQKWWRIRSQALERDDYECQHCGVDDEELGRNPDVHHLQPVWSFEHVEDAHTMDNVIALCRSCHRRAEDGQIAVSPVDEK